jgi:hypothetical protein
MGREDCNHRGQAVSLGREFGAGGGGVALKLDCFQHHCDWHRMLWTGLEAKKVTRVPMFGHCQAKYLNKGVEFAKLT